LNRINAVLCIAPLDSAPSVTGRDSGEQSQIDDLCRRLDLARSQKDFKAADGLRAEIQNRGYVVKTSPNGTIAEKPLA
jgi:cysteinyl-tRNA synthetase